MSVKVMTVLMLCAGWFWLVLWQLLSSGWLEQRCFPAPLKHSTIIAAVVAGVVVTIIVGVVVGAAATIMAAAVAVTTIAVAVAVTIIVVVVAGGIHTDAAVGTRGYA